MTSPLPKSFVQVKKKENGVSQSPSYHHIQLPKQKNLQNFQDVGIDIPNQPNQVQNPQDKETDMGNQKIDLQNHQDEQNLIEETFCSKNKKIIIRTSLGTFIVLGIVIALILMFYNTVSARKHRTNIIQYTVKNDDNPYVKSVTDIQEGSYIVKGKGGIQKKVVVTTVTKTDTDLANPAGRTLQANNGTNEKQIQTVQTKSASSSVEIRCPITGISIKITSQNLDAVIMTNLNKILETLIRVNNQRPSGRPRPNKPARRPLRNNKRNLQDGTDIKEIDSTKSTQNKPETPRTIQYYDIIRLAKIQVEKAIQKANNNGRVTLQKLSEKKFDQTTKTFQPVVNSQTKEKITQSFALVTQAQVPVVKDLNDEREMSNAVAQVVRLALKKSGEFFRQSLTTILKESGVTLPKNDQKQISIFADQPSDTQKLCSTVSVKDNRVECTNTAWSSGALRVSQTPQTQSQALAISTVL